MNEMSNNERFKRNDKRGDDSHRPKIDVSPDSGADFVFCSRCGHVIVVTGRHVICPRCGMLCCPSCGQ